MMFNFIHVGHGKCLSTYFQNQWSNDPCYNYIHGMRLGNKLQKVFFDNQNIKLDFSDFKQYAQNNIMSYESFTYFGVSQEDELERGEIFFKRLEFIANKLKGLSKNVFLVIRNPNKFILSSHAQYIKRGGTKNAQDYFNIFESNFLSNLNIFKIIEIWEQNDFEVFTLPMEMFLMSPQNFWKYYEDKFNLNRPIKNISNNKLNNVTPSNEDLELKAKINLISDKLINNLNFMVSYDQPNLVSNYVKKVIRASFDRSTPPMKKYLKKIIKFTPDPNFRSLEVSNNFKNEINNSYSKSIKKYNWGKEYKNILTFTK